MFNNSDSNYYSNIVCPIDLDQNPQKTLPDIQTLAAVTEKLTNLTKEPFFMAVGFHKPHIPFKIPKR